VKEVLCRRLSHLMELPDKYYASKGMLQRKVAADAIRSGFRPFARGDSFLMIFLHRGERDFPRFSKNARARCGIILMSPLSRR
jgi:hypothetical protein